MDGQHERLDESKLWRLCAIGKQQREMEVHNCQPAWSRRYMKKKKSTNLPMECDKAVKLLTEVRIHRHRRFYQEYQEYLACMGCADAKNGIFNTILTVS